MTHPWFTAEVDDNWQPGDPLWSRENHLKSLYTIELEEPA